MLSEVLKSRGDYCYSAFKKLKSKDRARFKSYQKSEGWQTGRSQEI